MDTLYIFVSNWKCNIYLYLLFTICKFVTNMIFGKEKLRQIIMKFLNENIIKMIY